MIVHICSIQYSTEQFR